MGKNDKHFWGIKGLGLQPCKGTSFFLINGEH